MKIITLLKNIIEILKQTFTEFFDDHAIKYSAALAYYTIFSLAPALLIIMSLLGFFFGREAIEGEIYSQIDDLVSHEAALQIQEMIKNIHLSNENVFATSLGVALLLIGASGIFGEIQDSINSIWGIKTKPKKGIVKMLINRLLSFSMLISIGFILSVALILSAVAAYLGKTLTSMFPEVAVYFFFTIDNLLMFVAIVTLFTIIFKVLPDANIKLKYVIVGAIVTALLFMLGKYVIGLYLAKSKIATAYGAAASVLIIMVWAYYNAIILYFGAEFTQVYTQFIGGEIRPKTYAVLVDKTTAGPEEIKKSSRRKKSG